MNRREILAVVVIIIILALVLFPSSSGHWDQISPGPGLIDLQKTLLKSAADHHPLLKSQMKELAKPLETKFSPRYRFNFLGTEENWTLVVAHDDSEFYNQSGFTLFWHRLNYHPRSVYILSSTDNSLTIVSPRGIAERLNEKDLQP